ncbi:FliA/WhiG family RNA polymerase sigma factor [Armatimonas sp.]|uniref:sigma-70 family RNA polymerase sigma factor n=1 Tax=Armatimonas sp. TaxID=1872638 RepID=UPI00286AAA52|nr:FliA/WhiG family RNA polymerase sigma factor [Armatimonas sp.]
MILKRPALKQPSVTEEAKSLEERQKKKLWAEYVKARAPKLREEIIRTYAPLARRTVDRLQIAAWGCVNKEDLLSYAVLGLIDAIDRYDPTLQTSFEAFASPRIRGAVLDALRRLDWVPRSLRASESQLRQVFGRMESQLGRPPTNAEVADFMGVSEEDLDGMLSDVARTSLVSLDDLVAGMDSSPLADIALGSEDDDPYRDTERMEAKDRLAGAIAALPDREKQIVSLYYFQEMTFKEIGLILGVTEQRISQIHARAMLRMSHKLLRHQDLLLTLTK